MIPRMHLRYSVRVGIGTGSALSSVAVSLLSYVDVYVPWGSVSSNFWFKISLGLFSIGVLIVIVSVIVFFSRHLSRKSRRSTPTSTDRTPGYLRKPKRESVNDVEVDNELLLEVSASTHLPLGGGLQSGELPIRISTQGPVGQRTVSEDRSETWTWTYSDMTVVNESDEYIACHAWLIVRDEEGLIVDQLRRTPNHPLVLKPHEARTEFVEFQLIQESSAEHARFGPERLHSLEFFEIGSQSRVSIVMYPNNS
jgi:hypothetical protein